MKIKLFLIIIVTLMCNLVSVAKCIACASENQIEIIFGGKSNVDIDKLKGYCSEESCIIWQESNKVAYISKYDDKVLITIENMSAGRVYSLKLTIPTLVYQDSVQGRHYYIDPKFDPKKFNWLEAVRQELELLSEEKILLGVSSNDILDITELLDSEKKSGITVYHRPDSCGKSYESLSQTDDKNLAGWLIAEGENCITKDSSGCPKIYSCDCPRYIRYRRFPTKRIEDFNF